MTKKTRISLLVLTTGMLFWLLENLYFGYWLPTTTIKFVFDLTSEFIICNGIYSISRCFTSKISHF